MKANICQLPFYLVRTQEKATEYRRAFWSINHNTAATKLCHWTQHWCLTVKDQTQACFLSNIECCYRKGVIRGEGPVEVGQCCSDPTYCSCRQGLSPLPPTSLLGEGLAVNAGTKCMKSLIYIRGEHQFNYKREQMGPLHSLFLSLFPGSLSLCLFPLFFFLCSCNSTSRLSTWCSQRRT